MLQAGHKEKPNIVDYYPMLGRLFFNENALLRMKRGHGFSVGPFRGWSDRQGIPPWWTAHNNTKHGLDRGTFKEANLLNALHALGAFYFIFND